MSRALAPAARSASENYAFCIPACIAETQWARRYRPVATKLGGMDQEFVFPRWSLCPMPIQREPQDLLVSISPPGGYSPRKESMATDMYEKFFT